MQSEAYRILVVDDDPIAGQALCQALEHLHYRGYHAPGGQEALQQCQLYPQDLIFMDLYMPGMDGLRCAERLRQDQAYKDVPIIGVSASDITETERELLHSLDIHDFIIKPVSVREVQDMLLRHIPAGQHRTG